MSKFATRPTRTVAGTSVLASEGTTVNHEGVSALGKTDKTDLFLLGVTNFVSEDTFYDSGSSRDARFVDLIHAVTKEDPEWVAQFAKYLRGTANMRSASVVVAVEYVRAGGENGRAVVASVAQRPDEPAEILAYYLSTYGRRVPAPIKRGVADAAKRLYSERSFIKYGKGDFPFADVIQLSHVKPANDKQSALFKHVLDRYYNTAAPAGEDLPMVGLYDSLNKMDKSEARKLILGDTSVLSKAGMTWESLSSFGKMDKAAWEAIIPNMGYMALLRNLRNFDEAGVSDEVADQIIAKLTDPDEVAKSRQLLFRFYSAYKNAPSLRWGRALEKAMDLSTRNIPEFKGKTLVLVDTSASMTRLPYTAKSTVVPADAAALFGYAIAKRNPETTVNAFATLVATLNLPKGGSVLGAVKSLNEQIGVVGHGTDIRAALESWTDEDRIILLTDMQSQRYVDGIRSVVPTKVPIYGFDLTGYASTVMDSAQNMYQFGGLTDNTFSLITSLEAARDASWPWDE